MLVQDHALDCLRRADQSAPNEESVESFILALAGMPY
jgi:hypothetical protein